MQRSLTFELVDFGAFQPQNSEHLSCSSNSTLDCSGLMFPRLPVNIYKVKFGPCLMKTVMGSVPCLADTHCSSFSAGFIFWSCPFLEKGSWPNERHWNNPSLKWSQESNGGTSTLLIFFDCFSKWLLNQTTEWVEWYYCWLDGPGSALLRWHVLHRSHHLLSLSSLFSSKTTSLHFLLLFLWLFSFFLTPSFPSSSVSFLWPSRSH